MTEPSTEPLMELIKRVRLACNQAESAIREQVRLTPRAPEPLDLDAIQARSDAATPGPWKTLDATPHDYLYPDGAIGIVAGTPENGTDVTGWSEFLTSADASFIAHARTDVPALVAEIRRLRQDLEWAQAAADQAHEEIRHLLAQRAELLTIAYYAIDWEDRVVAYRRGPAKRWPIHGNPGDIIGRIESGEFGQVQP